MYEQARNEAQLERAKSSANMLDEQVVMDGVEWEGISVWGNCRLKSRVIDDGKAKGATAISMERTSVSRET